MAVALVHLPAVACAGYWGETEAVSADERIDPLSDRPHASWGNDQTRRPDEAPDDDVGPNDEAAVDPPLESVDNSTESVDCDLPPAPIPWKPCSEVIADHPEHAVDLRLLCDAEEAGIGRLTFGKGRNLGRESRTGSSSRSPGSTTP